MDQYIFGCFAFLFGVILTIFIVWINFTVPFEEIENDVFKNVRMKIEELENDLEEIRMGLYVLNLLLESQTNQNLDFQKEK